MTTGEKCFQGAKYVVVMNKTLLISFIMVLLTVCEHQVGLILNLKPFKHFRLEKLGYWCARNYESSKISGHFRLSDMVETRPILPLDPSARSSNRSFGLSYLLVSRL